MLKLASSEQAVWQGLADDDRLHTDTRERAAWCVRYRNVGALRTFAITSSGVDMPDCRRSVPRLAPSRDSRYFSDQSNACKSGGSAVCSSSSAVCSGTTPVRSREDCTLSRGSDTCRARRTGLWCRSASRGALLAPAVSDCEGNLMPTLATPVTKPVSDIVDGSGSGSGSSSSGTSRRSPSAARTEAHPR